MDGFDHWRPTRGLPCAPASTGSTSGEHGRGYGRPRTSGGGGGDDGDGGGGGNAGDRGAGGGDDDGDGDGGGGRGGDGRNAECEDGIDNDGDGKIDFPNDPQCTSRSDDSEADGALAFTGVDLLIISLAGVLMLAAGLGLRRLAAGGRELA